METEDQNLLDDDRAPDAPDRVEVAPDAGGDDTFELEVDGQTHTLPAALKGAFLRQADYTRKTQELAEHRRTLAADREALDRQAAAHRNATGDQLRLAALDHQLAEFGQVDWEIYAAREPEAAKSLWDTAQRVAAARAHLAQVVAHHGERAQLADARRNAEAMAAAGRKLADEIDGWSPEVAAKLVDYAGAFGVSPDELSQAADPRLWKLLHRAWRAEASDQAEARAQAQSVRPAATVSGGGGAGGGVRDDLATREWMRRRAAQMAGGR